MSAFPHHAVHCAREWHNGVQMGSMREGYSAHCLRRRPSDGIYRSMTGTIESIDLNHLKVFERVAALGGFSAAARALGLPKSNVSRAIGLLEASLGTRLFQRTTRSVLLTAAGEALRDRCATLLEGLDEALEYVSSLSGAPRGHIKISAGIGFGVNVLSELLPVFLERFPEIRVTLDLSTRVTDMVAEGVDCAIRFGPLPDPTLVSTQLGTLRR